jgi:hypothetical protein
MHERCKPSPAAVEGRARNNPLPENNNDDNDRDANVHFPLSQPVACAPRSRFRDRRRRRPSHNKRAMSSNVFSFPHDSRRGGRRDRRPRDAGPYRAMCLLLAAAAAAVAAATRSNLPARPVRPLGGRPAPGDRRPGGPGRQRENEPRRDLRSHDVDDIIQRKFIKKKKKKRKRAAPAPATFSISHTTRWICRGGRMMPWCRQHRAIPPPSSSPWPPPLVPPLPLPPPPPPCHHPSHDSPISLFSSTFGPRER